MKFIATVLQAAKNKTSTVYLILREDRFLEVYLYYH